MTLTEIAIDDLALITCFDAHADMNEMSSIMRLGVVPGLEIRKLGEVATCAEYRIEGVSARLVISKELSDYIIVDLLDETIE